MVQTTITSSLTFAVLISASGMPSNEDVRDDEEKEQDPRNGPCRANDRSNKSLYYCITAYCVYYISAMLCDVLGLVAPVLRTSCKYGI